MESAGNMFAPRPVRRRYESLPILHAAIDTDMAEVVARQQAEENTGPLRCRPGCAACCHVLVTAPVVEGVHIIDALCRTEAGRQRVAAMVPTLHAQSLWMARPGTDSMAVAGRGLPCVLLDNDLRCTVYAVRPAVCRTHSTYSDPRLCFEPETPVGLVMSPGEAYVRDMAGGNDFDRLARERGLTVNCMAPLQFGLFVGVLARMEGMRALANRFAGSCFGLLGERWSILPWLHQVADDMPPETIAAAAQRMREEAVGAGLDPAITVADVLPARPPRCRPRDLLRHGPPARP